MSTNTMLDYEISRNATFEQTREQSFAYPMDPICKVKQNLPSKVTENKEVIRKKFENRIGSFKIESGGRKHDFNMIEDIVLSCKTIVLSSWVSMLFSAISEILIFILRVTLFQDKDLKCSVLPSAEV
uniref:Uncharacterized protein n=1 Tax=Glossina brevipalpis TaxID=37001 RepID=A0A1A9WF18_9MUSC